jgi:hypothetical protein
MRRSTTPPNSAWPAFKRESKEEVSTLANIVTSLSSPPGNMVSVSAFSQQQQPQSTAANSIDVELSCIGSQLPAIPTEIGKLTWLKVRCLLLVFLLLMLLLLEQICRFDHNQLSSLPVEIGQLVLLEVLILSHNRLSSLPSEIGDLRRLSKLHLDFNHLTHLPPSIGNLTSLSDLQLDNNPITHLPLELCYCTQLRYLSLAETPQLLFPPSSVLNSSGGSSGGGGSNNITKDILEYLRDTLESSRPNYRMKMLVVGQQQSGKTSFLRCLTKGQQRSGSSKKVLQPTRGIEISTWDFKIKDEETQSKQTFSFSIFDFSGQGNLFHHFIMTQLL